MVRFILMSLLSVAVVATGVTLALRSGSPGVTDGELRRLMRDLADSDPDVRRDAETAIRKAGPAVIPALKQASGSDDAVLAARAARMLRQIEGSPAARHDEAEPVEAALSPVEISIQVLKPRLAPGELPPLYLRLRNAGPYPVLIARQRLGPFALYGAFARFEIVGPEGPRVAVPADAAPRGADSRAEVIAVGPNETVDLFRLSPETGRPLLERLMHPGSYEIRFIYDAAERGAYREVIAANPSVSGSPLPIGRIVSNGVTIIVE